MGKVWITRKATTLTRFHAISANFSMGLTHLEIKILSGQTSVQSFTTGDKVVPPIVVLGEVTNISDSNGTLHYELQSFDGAEPEIVFYWGTFDQKKNPGLWEHSHSLGQQGVGKGQLQVGGFAPATKVYYQVQAKGSPYDAWALDSGEFKTVSLISFPVLEMIWKELIVLKPEWVTIVSLCEAGFG